MNTKTHLYLGYGMNTNIDSMRYRCPDAVFINAVRLSDYRLRFAYHADVVYERGSSVWCALWQISDEDLASLDILEGYPGYYQRKLVPTPSRYYPAGLRSNSWIYYMAQNEPDAYPDNSYLNMLMEGYAECGMPKSQLVDALAALDDDEMRHSRANTYLKLARKSLNTKDLWF
jgi:hypothetical protein